MKEVYTAVSRKLSVKAYATMPKGFMGNGCLQLSDRISRCFSPREKESIKNGYESTCVHMLSPCIGLMQREDRLSNSNWHYP